MFPHLNSRVGVAPLHNALRLVGSGHVGAVVGVLGIVVDVGVLGGKVGGIGQVTCPPSIVFVESFA